MTVIKFTTEAMLVEFDHLIRGGGPGTLFLAGASVAIVLVVIAASCNLLGQWFARWRWQRAYAERQPIPITDARRQQLRALSGGRTGR